MMSEIISPAAERRPHRPEQNHVQVRLYLSKTSQESEDGHMQVRALQPQE